MYLNCPTLITGIHLEYQSKTVLVNQTSEWSLNRFKMPLKVFPTFNCIFDKLTLQDIVSIYKHLNNLPNWYVSILLHGEQYPTCQNLTTIQHIRMKHVNEPGGLYYKTFYSCNVQIFIISKSTCPWQAFPA
jgi:hypothetical protein